MTRIKDAASNFCSARDAAFESYGISGGGAFRRISAITKSKTTTLTHVTMRLIFFQIDMVASKSLLYTFYRAGSHTVRFCLPIVSNTPLPDSTGGLDSDISLRNLIAQFGVNSFLSESLHNGSGNSIL